MAIERNLYLLIPVSHTIVYRPSYWTIVAMMYTSNVLLSAALLLSTCSAAPIDQLPLEKHEAAKYPFKNDPYDRKHDTYGDGVQPLPVVCFSQKSLEVDYDPDSSSAMAMVPACWAR